MKATFKFFADILALTTLCCIFIYYFFIILEYYSAQVAVTPARILAIVVAIVMSYLFLVLMNCFVEIQNMLVERRKARDTGYKIALEWFALVILTVFVLTQLLNAICNFVDYLWKI